MSKFQTTTRGGHDYRITGRDPEFASLIRGEVDDSGVTIHVQWTEGGRCNLDSESQYDLIPVEPEASPAKARVDLALAAHCLLTAVVEFQRAEDAVEQHKKLLLNAFVASGKTEVVVKIDGEHYRFWTNETRVFFRKIEVL
jgi:hypothetical protein